MRKIKHNTRPSAVTVLKFGQPTAMGMRPVTSKVVGPTVARELSRQVVANGRAIAEEKSKQDMLSFMRNPL